MHKNLYYKSLIIFTLITFVYQPLKVNHLFAQAAESKSPLYEQASEVSGLITQYGQDMNAIRDFYSPYTAINGYEDQSVQTSPMERQRLNDIGNDYLEKLKTLDFDSMSIYGQVDYILLKKQIV